MTDPAIPLGWNEEPDAADYIFDGIVLLTSPFWVTCVVAGWTFRLPWRFARAVRRYRGTR